MFLPAKPSDEQIRNFIAAQRQRAFSYREIGASNGAIPAGYKLDHNRIKLGEGPDVFNRAVAAMRRWQMFNLGWVQICWPDAPIVAGSTVAMLASAFGIWTLNACRIVYVIDDDGPTRRFGFAYGTLPDHVARGEERFLIEWNRGDNAVYYDILALSQPNQLLTRLGYPVMRLMQKRFARDSKRVMAAAAQATR